MLYDQNMLVFWRPIWRLENAKRTILYKTGYPEEDSLYPEEDALYPELNLVDWRISIRISIPIHIHTNTGIVIPKISWSARGAIVTAYLQTFRLHRDRLTSLGFGTSKLAAWHPSLFSFVLLSLVRPPFCSSNHRSALLCCTWPGSVQLIG